MTEGTWLKTRRGPVAMVRQVGPHLTRRQILLLGAATYRLLWTNQLLEVETVERYADGQIDEAEFMRVRDRMYATPAEEGTAAMHLQLLFNYAVLDGYLRLLQWVTSNPPDYGHGMSARRTTLCDLLREIAGNPFRPWKAIPEAMGGGLVQPDGATVRVSAAARGIAAGVAAEQAFDRLPVLADALEDGGVTDAELLAHCRRPGGHLRGCWAVDVVLGRG